MIKFSVVGKAHSFIIESEKTDTILDMILKKYPQLCVNAAQKQNSKAYFREYIADLFSQKEVEKTTKMYHFDGWYLVDGAMQYLSASMPTCISETYIPYISKEDFVSVYQKGISFLTVARPIKNNDGEVDVVSTLQPILPLFLYVHLAHAAKLFQDAGRDLQFVLACIGESGSLKTSVAKTLVLPFMNDEYLNFQSTPRAIELYRKKAKNKVMLLDDIYSSQDRGAIEKFENVLRCFGDGVGRSKSDATFNQLESISVLGGCVITAEQDLGSQQSSALRYVTTKVNRDSFDSNILLEYQKNSRIAKRDKENSWMQMYFGAWIRYLEANYLDSVAFITAFEEPLLKIKFKRAERNFQLLATVAKLVMNFGLEVGALSKDEVESTYQVWREVLIAVAMYNQETAVIAEPYQIWLQYLEQGIASGVITIAETRKKYEQSGSQQYFGYYDKERYMFDPDKIFIGVKTAIQLAGKTLLSDSTGIYKKLFELGLIEGYIAQRSGHGAIRNRYFKRVKMNGSMMSVLVVNISKLKQTLEDFYK